MTAYYIGEHSITDGEAFDRYLAEVIPMIERAGGRYLTKPGSHQILEGDWKPNRVVIVEFPDLAAAKSWYESAEYRPLIALRQKAARDVMMIVDGR
jgi:uncharacterized protein (DUF1330 family)